MTTHASTKRRGRGISAVERAKLLTHFEGRIAARRAADPSTPFQDLFRLANPLHVGAESRIVNGRVVGLSDHHERLRRCFAFRAWCALQIARATGEKRDTRFARGWHNEARKALEAARIHRKLAASAREAGR